MKTNIRGKIKRFLESEDGRVSTKAPLALGVAIGSVLLAQAMVPSTAEAHFQCHPFKPCPAGQVCLYWAEAHWPGPIIIWHSDCVDRQDI